MLHFFYFKLFICFPDVKKPKGILPPWTSNRSPTWRGTELTAPPDLQVHFTIFQNSIIFKNKHWQNCLDKCLSRIRHPLAFTAYWLTLQRDRQLIDWHCREIATDGVLHFCRVASTEKQACRSFSTHTDRKSVNLITFIKQFSIIISMYR